MKIKQEKHLLTENSNFFLEFHYMDKEIKLPLIQIGEKNFMIKQFDNLKMLESLADSVIQFYDIKSRKNKYEKNNQSYLSAEYFYESDLTKKINEFLQNKNKNNFPAKTQNENISTTERSNIKKNNKQYNFSSSMSFQTFTDLKKAGKEPNPEYIYFDGIEIKKFDDFILSNFQLMTQVLSFSMNGCKTAS